MRDARILFDSDVQSLTLKALDKRVLPVDIDVDSPAAIHLVPLTVDKASSPSFDLVIDKPSADDVVDAGFSQAPPGGAATILHYKEVASGGTVLITVRYRGPSASAAALPRSMAIERRIVQQPKSGGGQGIDGKLRLAVRFVTSRFEPPRLSLQSAGVDYLSQTPFGTDDAGAEDDIIVVAALVIAQSLATVHYAGRAQALNVAIGIAIDGATVAAADISTRLQWRDDAVAGIWSSGPGGPIPLPIRDEAEEPAPSARLAIGIKRRSLQAALRATAIAEEQWHGTLALSATAWCAALDEPDPGLSRPDTLLPIDNMPLERSLTVSLRHTLQLKIATLATVDIPFETRESLQELVTAPYRRTIDTNVRHTVDAVDETLELRLLGTLRTPGASVEATAQIVSGAAVSRAVDLTDWYPADRASSAVPVLLPLRLLLDQVGLLEAARQRGLCDARLELRLRWRSPPSPMKPGQPKQDPPKQALIVMPIALEAAAPRWLVCVDLGTSATAVWLGSSLLAAKPARPLPLGSWLGRTDKAHDEYLPGRRPEDQILIPSHIGLSSARHYRQDTDLLSLGDIGLAGAGPAAVERRLQHFGRRYDLSVPFVPASELPAYAGQIVFDPKRRLMMPGKTIALGGQVYEAGPDGVVSTNAVDIAALITDYFDELGRYVVPSALMEAADPSLGQTAGATSLLEKWFAGFDDLGVVLTYPSGIADERRQVYRDAGRRLAAALAGAPPRHSPDDAWVKLIPEAVAAAHYGIAEIIGAQNLQDGDAYSFGAIDIGAGTYDVTLVQVSVRNKAIASWKVLSHFGVLLGGHDLDRAIAARIQQILAAASRQAGTEEHFSCHLDLPCAPAELHAAEEEVRRRGNSFLRELQRAKRVLTDALLDREHYRWLDPDAAEDAPRFEITLWRSVYEGDWPIDLTMKTLNGPATQWQIDGVDAVLRYEREPEAMLILSLGASVFMVAPEQPNRSDPGSVVELMGRELPAMAAAEAEMLGMRETRWIVTGRAALWPPLYEEIGRSVSGALAQARPFRPDVMKQAVLLGATDLAREPHLDLGTEVVNSLAILSDGRRMRPGVEGSHRGTLRYIDASREKHGFVDDIRVYGRFQIVRALPGLDDPTTCDRRLALLDAMEIRPWVDVCNRDFSRSPTQTASGAARFRIEWQHVGTSSIRLIVTDPAANAPYEIGPIPHNGRLYGPW
jgi:hypothetical protein